jgi:hypothetical protein
MATFWPFAEGNDCKTGNYSREIGLSAQFLEINYLIISRNLMISLKFNEIM